MSAAPWRPTRRDYLILAMIAGFVAGIVALSWHGPSYTDAYYYFNAGQRLAAGDGLTDPYVALTYIGAPDALPAPSHTYWMPLTSLIVALGGGTLRGAQVILVGLWVGLALLAFGLGARLGGSRRHAWTAGLLTVACGYYAALLVMPDTFAPFGLFGAGCLLAMGLGRERTAWRWFAFSGALAALAHLTRADGLLLVIVIGLAALLPAWFGGPPMTVKARLGLLAAGIAAYVLVMLPWFVRNVSLIGTPLPVGGTATIWLRGYNEIVSYPPDLSPAHFLAWGWDHILASRWTAFTNNLGTFVAVEGLIVLAPLMVIGLVKRWRHPWLLPVWLYALGLHAAMTLVFAYPGYRGGLFHSAAALLPWWMVLGILGLDDVIDWVAARRHGWRPAQAKLVFTAGVLVIAVALTVTVTTARLSSQPNGATYTRLAADVLPPDAVVMSNDPAALYYYTGLPGVVVPDGGPDVIRALVDRYGLTHVLLDSNHTAPLEALYAGRVLPDFLQLIPQDVAPAIRVFEVVR